MTVRAKFKCTEITDFGSHKRYKFNAIGDDGTPENERYHRYTPSGILEMTVDNPAVTFAIQEAYYLDFSPVE